MCKPVHVNHILIVDLSGIYIYIEKQTPHFELQFLVIMRGIARPSKDSKRQTQVVASLGPASWSEETLLASRAMPLSYLAGEA